MAFTRFLFTSKLFPLDAILTPTFSIPELNYANNADQITIVRSLIKRQSKQTTIEMFKA